MTGRENPRTNRTTRVPPLIWGPWTERCLLPPRRSGSREKCSWRRWTRGCWANNARWPITCAVHTPDRNSSGELVRDQVSS